jgi:transposase
MLQTFIPERTKNMHSNHNMNQLTLDLSTSFSPRENHVAIFINELVESLQINEPYLFGIPREYDLGAMMKLVLFAYTRETFTSRKIERLAEENLYARWLIQESVPSYRTIARFRISNDVQELTNKGLTQLTEYLRMHNLIDDALLIDGTKILDDANKYSFVWKKNTIRFDQMNREELLLLMTELKEAYAVKQIPEGTSLSLDMVDELLTRMELRLERLEKEVEATKHMSPNPAKNSALH